MYPTYIFVPYVRVYVLASNHTLKMVSYLHIYHFISSKDFNLVTTHSRMHARRSVTQQVWIVFVAYVRYSKNKLLLMIKYFFLNMLAISLSSHQLHFGETRN